MKLAVAAAILSTSFWHLNPGSNEMEYWVSGVKPNSYQVCGFVSTSAPDQAGYGTPEGYVADVIRSRGADESQSQLFNTFDGAKAFVEQKCTAK